MNLAHPYIKILLEKWQTELRQLLDTPATLVVVMDPKTSDSMSRANFDTIRDVVCHVTGISYDRVLKKSRKREVVVARQLICYWSRAMTKFSLKEIGLLIGGKDHTTVIHSCNAVNNLLKTGDNMMTEAYYQVQRLLREQTIETAMAQTQDDPTRLTQNESAM